MIRTIQLSLVLGALVGCTSNSTPPAQPAAFDTASGAVEQVCVQPTSHGELTKAVRSLDWRSLSPDDLPPWVAGNGMVTWSTVATSPAGDMIVAAGRLGGTSFCRIYVEDAAANLVRPAMQQASVLGKPLGTPDFRQRIDDLDVTGWHRSAGEDWRVVHISVHTSAGQANAPVMIEVTRPAA